jgi:sarcosine oxidase subunit alpha
MRVGLFEASPLGKIEIKGPDAAIFLDRVYANAMSSLKPGRLRYGLMLNEFGVVIDDGVTARLGDDHFLVGTTGAGAERIATMLDEWLQCEWRELDVIAAPVTQSWGVLTLSGPLSRAVLREAGADFDLGPEAFAHMQLREGTVAGLPARVARVSFTGEVSFEISVAGDATPLLWRRLLEAGAPHGLQPVGVEAWMHLRTEKGFIHVGADTDGATTALDVGWGHVLKRQGDFIGRRSLTRDADQQGDRFQFVGLEALDGHNKLPVGAHARKRGEGGSSEGYVTSSVVSTVLGRPVALAMVRGGRARMGEVLDLHVGERVRPARVCAPGGYDPKGERLNA